MKNLRRRALVWMVFGVVAVQSLLWVADGRKQLVSEVVDWYFTTGDEYRREIGGRVDYREYVLGYETDIRSPSATIFIAKDDAREIGDRRLRRIGKRAAASKVMIRIANDSKGDRFVYGEVFNTPIFGRTYIGSEALPFCSLVGSVNLVYFMGFWVRVPDLWEIRKMWWGAS
ncbi:MAG: hypothetical protein GY769_10925 [bacterium]|nr:hypothetical protein [bacterium]